MKQLLIMLLFLCSASVSAQDVIVKKDGTMINCRVVELTESEIVYKKWSDLNGSNYVMERSAASAINYQNGKKVNLSEATNLYTPNNQNDGVQQYNDRALLAMDYGAYKYNKIKSLKKTSWIGGIAGVGVGIIFLYLASERGVNENEHTQYIVGSVSCVAGVACFATCQLLANHYHKKYYQYHSQELYHYNIRLENGSSLSAGLDVLSDRAIGNNTLGLGIRYNF